MTKYSVQVENVSKIYNSSTVEVDALTDVSFSLKQGEFTAIVGPSGSGKSTLMHILGTIDKPTKGEVYIDGIPTSAMDGNKLSEFRNKKLGFVFQAFNLVGGISAEKNVELPLMVNPGTAAERRKIAESLLIEFGLENRLNLKPTQLSGGEQQRVAIARSLVNNPSLILADEPTGDLDTKAGAQVIKVLSNVCKHRNVTTVIVTHNLDIIKHFDHVIYIKDGRMEKETWRRK